MKVAVVGLWHLGTVTAACVAAMGRRVLAYDPDPQRIAALRAGRWPVAEPGLAELAAGPLADGRLTFSDEPRALGDADVVWITFDTPVDDEDHADVELVRRHVTALFPQLKDGALVLISAQVPVGTTRELEAAFSAAYPGRDVAFAYSPENLRLGKAIEVFTQPDRVVVGYRRATDRERIAALFAPFSARIEWMSVESAELTKHALNAFLAVSVTFANELAALSEHLGADAREVERGLKSEARIGPRAYLRPGAAFAGGTLARDIQFLAGLAQQAGVPTPLLASVRASNESHKGWAGRRLNDLLGDLRGRTVGLLGLTYKPGTDTLRRSAALETARWLSAQGARVQAFDPAVRELPGEYAGCIRLVGSVEQAVRESAAVLIATAWPEFRALRADDLAAWMDQPLVLDPDGFLESALRADARIRYVTVGSGGNTRAGTAGQA